MTNKIAFIALVAGALFLAGCNQKGKEEAAQTQQAAAPVQLAVPQAGDTQGWKLYLVSVAKQHMDGIRSPRPSCGSRTSRPS